jgi:hypothetical protein
VDWILRLAAWLLVAATGVAQPLQVDILSPLTNSVSLEPVTAFGSSPGATSVSLSVDGGAPIQACGQEWWQYTFTSSTFTPGLHTLLVTATDGTNCATDGAAFWVSDVAEGLRNITYLGSDQEILTGKLYVPTSYDPAGSPVPLVCDLHGSIAVGGFPLPVQAELEARGWLGIAPDGRLWDLRDHGCFWPTSPAWVNTDNPLVGPGEDDVFQAIDWVESNFTIDPDRRYLTGFSYGGRGAYSIGLKNPDQFAAVVSLAPPTDLFEIHERVFDEGQCGTAITGGKPGDSPRVDTMHSVTSARFLLENAFNLPVFHGHGLNDDLPINIPGTPHQYLHGLHITLDSSWNGCHDDHLPSRGPRSTGNPQLFGSLCFGHTPTLQELQALHPTGYPWAYLFTQAPHELDLDWWFGASVGPGKIGVPHPGQPGQLLGAFDFLASYQRISSPTTVVFKTYEDEHSRAYWTQIQIEQPWSNVPGAIRATRDAAGNQLHLELTRVSEATLDLTAAGLSISRSAPPLLVSLSQLVEPGYDPALLPGPTEVLQTTLVLSGDFSTLASLMVLRDGQPLPGIQVQWTATQITVGPLTVPNTTILEFLGAG